MKNRKWLIIKILAIFISFLAYTPLVIPQNIIKPFFLGMPYTLWIGIIISITLIILTILGAIFAPNIDKTKSTE